MRLNETQIRLVCQKLLHTLRGKQLIHLKANEAEILSKMEEIFAKDLKVEDQINEEAEKILEQYASKAGSDLDRDKMFQMIKRELIKKKNAVI